MVTLACLLVPATLVAPAEVWRTNESEESEDSAGDQSSGFSTAEAVLLQRPSLRAQPRLATAPLPATDWPGACIKRLFMIAAGARSQLNGCGAVLRC